MNFRSLWRNIYRCICRNSMKLNGIPALSAVLRFSKEHFEIIPLRILQRMNLIHIYLAKYLWESLKNCMKLLNSLKETWKNFTRELLGLTFLGDELATIDVSPCFIRKYCRIFFSRNFSNNFYKNTSTSAAANCCSISLRNYYF